MPNRLAEATSPYLRLHAENPVDWYPWGEEAFRAAAETGRPIFLSIGYFTCHWCHVMERESFSDPAVAEILNREFVSIKVDREERPDVDRLYMAFVQATTGGGGWPLSAFLTPERKPFYGGTYFPPGDRHGLPGFPRLLLTLAEAWRSQREQVLASAANVGEFLAKSLQGAGSAAPVDAVVLKAEVWARLAQELSAGFDRERGGFGDAPKFPRSSVYAFLLRHGGEEARAMVVQTLRAMAAGGIHDQLGGGFHRYATDAGWMVPHFEKMLYDQAQLAVSYCEAWQVTQAPEFAEVARSTCEFVLREMAAPEGGFFSAQDADSWTPEGDAEGAYYLWTEAELRAAGATGEFEQAYGVAPGGNVPAHLDPHGEFRGRNILLLAGDGAPPSAAERMRFYDLRRARPDRPAPATDDKVLTSWNALMISGLATCGAVLEEQRFLKAAQQAARFLRDTRWDGLQGQLRHTPAIDGFVEDYAYLTQALLDLHQADGDASWLTWAEELQQAQERRFTAPEGGYYSAGEDPHLWLRLREDYDGAEPSPNSVALSNLLRLGIVLDRVAWRERAERLLAAYADRLRQVPQALPAMAAALGLAAAPPATLTLTGDPGAVDTRALAQVARRGFYPNVMLLWASGSDKAAAMLCRNYVCGLPVRDTAALARELSCSK